MTAGGEFDELLAAARAGADWAITALYREFDPRLRAYLRARVGDEADDLASEVWLGAARTLRDFSGDRAAFRAWLFTIGRRRLADHHRKTGRRPVVVMAPQDLASLPAGADGGASPADDVLDALALADTLRRVVALLPADQAEVVLLRVVGGFDVAEVAVLVGRRPGHVRVLQHRGLRRLAQLLPDGAVTPGAPPAI